jgi:alpha-glucosidase
MRRLTATLAAVIGLTGLTVSGALARGTDSVSLGRAAVSLRSAHVGVRITRRPYRLAITRPSGASALSEVANRSAAPLSVGVLEDPFGSGLDRTGGPALYAPLTFLVGSERLTQREGGVWGGDLLHGVRDGVVYSARRVLRARRTAGGVSLLISTDDPSGRRLRVLVRALPRGAVRVTASPIPARGVVEVGDSFASGPSEGFFGFGGRHNAVDQHGQVLSSWVSEENLDNVAASSDMYPNGNTAAYDPQPEFFSTRPYGFLLAQSQLARFRLDVGAARAWSVSAVAPRLDYIVAAGPAPRAMAMLTALSGRQPVPPSWALGPMLDRLVKTAGETTADYEAAIQSDLAQIARTHLPLTAYRIEGWGFPGPSNGIALHVTMTPGRQAALIRGLRARRIHP